MNAPRSDRKRAGAAHRGAHRWVLAAMFGVAALASRPLWAAGQPFTVMLDWFVNPDHAPLVVAKEMGFFAKQGLDVHLISPSDPNDPPKLAAAGKVDVALTYQPQVYLQVQEGLPLRCIGTLIATPLNTLMTVASGPVKSIADLKGRKVGYSVGGFEDVLLRAMLKKHGLTLHDVKLVNVNFSLVPALLTRRVAAVIGAYRNVEANEMALKGHPARVFYPEDEGVPPYDELVLVTRADRVDDPRMRRFMTALQEGVLYLVNHPRKSWKLFIKYRPSLNNELNRLAWKDTLARFALRPAALDAARWARFARFLAREGVIKKALPVHDYAVQLPWRRTGAHRLP